MGKTNFRRMMMLRDHDKDREPERDRLEEERDRRERELERRLTGIGGLGSTNVAAQTIVPLRCRASTSPTMKRRSGATAW